MISYAFTQTVVCASNLVDILMSFYLLALKFAVYYVLIGASAMLAMYAFLAMVIEVMDLLLEEPEVEVNFDPDLAEHQIAEVAEVEDAEDVYYDYEYDADMDWWFRTRG